jgi:hypothetical protein
MLKGRKDAKVGNKLIGLLSSKFLNFASLRLGALAGEKSESGLVKIHCEHRVAVVNHLPWRTH